MMLEPSGGWSNVHYTIDLSPVAPALALLARQPVLLAVTLHVTAGDVLCEITVSKAVDEAGTVLAEYWWEVDRLTEAEQGQQQCRERRWGLGLRPYETAEAAYLAAMAWVQAPPEGPLTPADGAVQ